jgi:hypothetical protein
MQSSKLYTKASERVDALVTPSKGDSKSQYRVKSRPVVLEVESLWRSVNDDV